MLRVIHWSLMTPDGLRCDRVDFPARLLDQIPEIESIVVLEKVVRIPRDRPTVVILHRIEQDSAFATAPVPSGDRSSTTNTL